MIHAIIVEMSDIFGGFEGFEGFGDEVDEHQSLSAEEVEASLTRVPDVEARALSDDEMCPICLNALSRGGVSRIVACRHAFCDTCIRTWLSTPRGVHCPVCKRAVSTQRPSNVWDAFGGSSPSSSSSV
jgi:hypothetical protein